jgi:hypothetical protein
MVNRWRALPPPTRMWVMGGVIWFPLILLELVLGILVGGTRAWTPIFVSLIVIGVVTGGTFWVLGAMRAVRLVRAGRRQGTSGSPPGPGLP